MNRSLLLCKSMFGSEQAASSRKKTSGRKLAIPLRNPTRRRFWRPLSEALEARCMLDAGQWLMVFRDLTLGTNLDEQGLAAQQFLYDSGINDVRIVRAEDLEGTFIVQT